METRANHIWVGAITLALLAGLAIFIVWIARFGDGTDKEYDIFFKQSVAGLAVGSGVAFSGVNAGQVTEVQLWEKDPEFVRVRIAVDENVPILQGTTATIQSVSFTAPPQIQLDGALKGQKPIANPGPEGVPVIPTKPGALGELLNSAPLLIERLATLTERLTSTLSPQNQQSIEKLLKESARLTESLADQSPQIGTTLKELQGTLLTAQSTLDKYGALADNANGLLGKEGSAISAELRKTLASAQTALNELQATAKTAQPGLKKLSDTTLPQTEALIRDLRETSAALTSLTERINDEGAASLLSAPPLPEYEP
ncbi:MlaD family protein [Parasphingorhabdus sp. DH2-15]|uniref:MlaD family protein n=1 Tax=Parasphingorhabdus sp. DH2-15 TaxID=3444112 RepID=UPI003F688562